ncbi:MAG: transporter [Thermoanaerobaculia bacterium]
MKAACVALLLAAPAAAQSPFLTDDAIVTPLHGIHLEITNRYDSLSPNDLPATSQYTGIVDFKWGILSRVEIGFDFPLLSIHGNDPGQPQTVTGLGDLDFSTKAVLLPEREGRWWPQVALCIALELPTGNPDNGLGSGVTDFGFNLIASKQVDDGITACANLGLTLTGNTLTGAEGLRPGRGAIFTGGLSLKKDLSKRLQLGLEVWGSITQTTVAYGSELRVQAGGSWALSEKVSLIFSAGAGWQASPRVGGSLGIAADF